MNVSAEREIRTLKNGLQVILIRRKDFIQSLFMIGIPAGSTNVVDETGAGRVVHPYGCAHYLEHQMFRLCGEDVTYPLARAGAKSNAVTSYNETCYYVWTYSDPFEPLSLLIDFVQTLEIDDHTVEKEKGIILSEYNQYDQDPESRLLKETYRSLYHSHPLREDILGRPQDIEEMKAEDLRLFYETWYDPSQLVLVGVTGQDLEPLFDLIEKKEREYPSRQTEKARKILPVEPDEAARTSFELEMDVDLSYACLGIKLKPEALSFQEALRQEYLLNLWLSGTFSSINPEFQSWIDTRLIGGMSGVEADIALDHACILIYAQTPDPNRYFETMKEKLLEKKPLDPEVFESLLIREKASALRRPDNFGDLASQSVEGFFKGIDPWKDLEILDSISLEEMTDYIGRLDFSAQSETRIVPLGQKSLQEDSFDREKQTEE